MKMKRARSTDEELMGSMVIMERIGDVSSLPEEEAALATEAEVTASDTDGRDDSERVGGGERRAREVSS